MIFRPDRSISSRNSAGFTLIEVMVVVVIVALMGGISMLALQQALSRPLSGQADQLQDWLESLVDRARLQGTTYGVRIEAQQWRALVYYRGQWLPLNEPAPFSMEGELELVLESRNRAEEDEAALPVLTLSAAGMEPDSFELQQSTADTPRFEFRWDSDERRLVRDNLQGGSR